MMDSGQNMFDKGATCNILQKNKTILDCKQLCLASHIIYPSI